MAITEYVKVKDLDRYLKDRGLKIIASAGPRPSITGMRRKFWGQDCKIIKSGNYIYKVS